MGEPRSVARGGGLRRVCARVALALGMGLVADAGAGCGVWSGEPLELFPQNANLDGGVNNGEPCIETPQPLAANGNTVVGATAFELMQLVNGDHSNAFLWSNGDKTRVILSVQNPRVTSIVSRTNRFADEPYTSRRCANHVRIDATLKISTGDGRLDESVGSVRMIAYAGDEVRGSITLRRIQGSYRPTLRREHCFIGATLRFLIAVDGTHGSMTDHLGATECAADGGALGSADYAGGHWGARWQNY